MNSYLVAVRNTKGELHRAPQPIGVLQVLSLLGRLTPYQELHISVEPEHPLHCGCRSCPRKQEEAPAAAATAPRPMPESPSRVQTEQEQ